jgi:serine/threonine protein phosphatase PrpC
MVAQESTQPAADSAHCGDSRFVDVAGRSPLRVTADHHPARRGAIR